VDDALARTGAGGGQRRGLPTALDHEVMNLKFKRPKTLVASTADRLRFASPISDRSRVIPHLEKTLREHAPQGRASPARPPWGVKQSGRATFARAFKEFVSRGNLIDPALGVITDAHFGKMVDPMPRDLMMPLLGKALGGLDFTTHFIMLASPPSECQGPFIREADTWAVGLRFPYESFIAVALDCPILAPVMFVRAERISRVRAAVPPAPPALARGHVVLLREIRDALKKSSRARARIAASIGPILPAGSRTTL
jgi:large conductance mechanosensitive channel